MVEMLMRRRSLLMASGPRPEPSDDGWELLTSYTTSGTWTAPWDGWFRLSCIGAGGTGGNGGVGVNNQSAPDDQESVSGSGGGGGGSGGFSSSVLYLKKGDSLSYSYNGNATLTVGIQGENITMVATVGGIGNNGSKGNIRHAIEYDPPRWVVTVPNGGTGGTAGTASGGNKINSNGLLGGTGSRGTVGKKTTATNGGSGAYSAIPKFSNIPLNTGKGGDGGKGGYYDGKKQPPTNGLSGTVGGVFIEKEKGVTG